MSTRLKTALACFICLFLIWATAFTIRTAYIKLPSISNYLKHVNDITHIDERLQDTMQSRFHIYLMEHYTVVEGRYHHWRDPAVFLTVLVPDQEVQNTYDADWFTLCTENPRKPSEIKNDESFEYYLSPKSNVKLWLVEQDGPYTILIIHAFYNNDVN